MSNRKTLQAPGKVVGPRNTRRPQQDVRGFWDWLFGGYYDG